MTGPYNTTAGLRTLLGFDVNQISTAQLEAFQKKAYSLIDGFNSAADTEIAASVEFELVKAYIIDWWSFKNHKQTGYDLKLRLIGLPNEFKDQLQDFVAGKSPLTGPSDSDYE